jgi:hypothetical protein
VQLVEFAGKIQAFRVSRLRGGAGVCFPLPMATGHSPVNRLSIAVRPVRQGGRYELFNILIVEV